MGILKIEQIISCRRMFYLQTILKREDKEITKRVYQVQKNSPLKEDWLKLVEGDFKTLGLELNETLIQN